MNLIAVSTRIGQRHEVHEEVDMLDRRWPSFLCSCGYRPLVMPNHLESALALVESLPVTGLVLTGGDHLAAYGGETPERDAVEIALYRTARQRRLPVLGVCRGAQLIIDLHGGTLSAIDGHVASTHFISGSFGNRQVNSFHGLAASGADAVGDLMVLASCGTSVEAVGSSDGEVIGIMWHPERMDPFEPADISLVQELFGSP